MKQKIISALLCAALCISLAACTQEAASAATDLSFEELDPSELFTERDKDLGYGDYVTVTLKDNGSAADGSGVSIVGNTVTIQEEGCYLFAGSLMEGQIVVDADSEAKVQLVLNGVTITSAHSPALYVREADKVFMTTAKDSLNSLSVTGDYIQSDENKVDAAVFSKDDLTLNGEGTLNVEAAYGHGLLSKNDLVLTSGSYQVLAAGHGLSGKDSVRIAGGYFTIESGKDAISAENQEDAALGFLYVGGGDFQLSAKRDGLSASSTLQIDGGTFAITSGGGSGGVDFSQKDESPIRKGQQAVPEAEAISEESAISTKGIKAVGNLLLKGGTVQVDSSDDALHTNANCAIYEGNIQLSSGDDGLHADGGVLIAGGTLNISKSYEGVEGQTITISGGSISSTSNDDGLNARNGSSEESKSNAITGDDGSSILISGGVVRLDASGDGIDSNGSLTVTGGEIYVSGPTNNGNAAVDYSGSAKVTGGVLIAAGSSGMAQNFGSDSTQGSMLVMLSSVQTGTITLQDESGNILLSYSPEKAYQSVLITAPTIQKGKTYTLAAGSETKPLTMTEILYGSGMEGRGGGGMQPNGGQQFFDGQHPAGGGKGPLNRPAKGHPFIT